VDLTEAEARIHRRALERIAESTAHRFDYLVRHLAAHLPDADERHQAFTTLMTDYRWLRERLRLAGVDALIGDCRHIGERNFGRLLAACLRNSAHVLRRDPGQLPAQLVGRLSSRTAVPAIAELCASARAAVERQVRGGQLEAALLPRSASLRLDIALQRVLEGHGGGVMALTVLPDGRLVAATAHRVLVWQRQFQEISAVFEADAHVYCLLTFPDGQMVAGDGSGRLHVLDLIERRN
jgi:WD40 repeat protein